MQITTLIPAYKPKYLNELLIALHSQTVRPQRVIFSDDSPNQAFVQALSQPQLAGLVAELNITVVPGPRTGAAVDNFRRLLDMYAEETELFHYLLDDDVIYPSFYQRHLQAHTAAAVQCVVSARWTANEAGQPLHGLEVPASVASHADRMLAIGPDVLFPLTVGRGRNWLGEFSNATLHRGMAATVLSPRLSGVSLSGLEDISSFVLASLKSPLVYINEHLGFFRTSPIQNTAQTMGRQMKLAFICWLPLAIASRRAGLISPQQCHAVLSEYAGYILHNYQSQPDLAPICAILPALMAGEPGAEDSFLSLWHAY